MSTGANLWTQWTGKGTQNSRAGKDEQHRIEKKSMRREKASGKKDKKVQGAENELRLFSKVQRAMALQSSADRVNDPPRTDTVLCVLRLF